MYIIKTVYCCYENFQYHILCEKMKNMKMKHLMIGGMFVLLVAFFSGNAFTFPIDDEVIIQGEVEHIAEDGTSLTVHGIDIFATPDFLKDAYLEVGDKVQITAEKTKSGLMAVGYRYMYEEKSPLPEINETISDNPLESGNAVYDRNNIQ